MDFEGITFFVGDGVLIGEEASSEGKGSKPSQATLRTKSLAILGTSSKEPTHGTGVLGNPADG